MDSDTVTLPVKTTTVLPSTTRHSAPVRAKESHECRSDFWLNLTSKVSTDNLYRKQTISLTASENFPSLLVRVAANARYGSFYELRSPHNLNKQGGEWSFPESGAIQQLIEILNDIGNQLFQAKAFDWRPNGGSTAELVIMLATCKRGDALMCFAHSDGGHFGVEVLAKEYGISIYDIPVIERTQEVDVDRLSEILRDHPNIKLVMLNQSLMLRWQPISRIKSALPFGVTLTYDASHNAALIAGGALPQPLLEGADILHANTHKTIAGPQKAFIAYADASNPLIEKISTWLVPGLQSNCHAEALLPMIVAFRELQVYGRSYAYQICKNARALAEELAKQNCYVQGEQWGFTATHQIHVITGSFDQTVKLTNDTLHQAGIRVNNLEIPGSGGNYGLRMGVQAMTRRGMKEEDFRDIARLLARLIVKQEDPRSIRHEVSEFLENFPLYPLAYSFDDQLDKDWAKDFLKEVLA